MVVLVALGFVLCAAGALVARVGIDPDLRDGGSWGLTRRAWRFVGGAIALAGLALVVYELVFCDC